VVNQELEFKIEQLDRMIKEWKRLFTLYRKILKPGEASPKEEREYAEVTTYFARTYQALVTRLSMKPDDQANLATMVTDVSDADAIREMSDMQRRKFENDWRVNNAAMNQKLGELQLLREELEEVSEIAFYARRFFSNRVIQITLGAAIIITLLGVFGIFRMAFQLAQSFIGSMK
jgi:hypothetical protein